MNRVYALVWNQALGCWNVTPEGARRRRRAGSGKGLLVAVASVLTIGGLPSAFALPSGETVVSGTADILRYDEQQQMSINQHTDKLILNWNDFSVEGGQTVTFNQPQSTSIALNRVIGANGSNIQGRINANGQVFLINPNGVVFSKSAQVNVGGLVASTQDMKNADFMAGNYKFAGTSTGRMINDGSITAADGGSVALIGRVVNNQGTIKAKNGRIALGAGDGFTVSFDSNNLLDLKVDAAAINALASNGGLLKADGGQVLMTAKSAGAMLNTVVNNTGAIEALTLSKKAGKITLDGGDVGVVVVGGSLNASALTEIGDGGVVETKGAVTQVQLAARVNTHAGNGKTGTWKISSSEVKVNPVSAPRNNTVYGDTLAHNLATTNIALSSRGDVTVDGAVSWASGNHLSIAADKNIQINNSLKGSGGATRIELNAGQDIALNSTLELSGTNSSLGLDYGGAYIQGKDGKVTLSGSGAAFDSQGQLYSVIQNATQLQGIGSSLGGRYVLGNDIKGSGRIKTIGGSAEFSGTFDGLGNTISGFTVNTDGPYGGLFARSSGSISNLNLAGMTIYGTTSNAGFSYVGGLVGMNHGMISNVNATNQRVYANSNNYNNLGGLVGVNSGGSIDRSSVAGIVSGNGLTLAVGGLVGENSNSPNPFGRGRISNSHTNVQVLGTMQISPIGGMGGLVGLNKNGLITDSSSAGTVGTGFTTYKKDPNFGGLVGYNQGGEIRKSHSSVNVVGYVASVIGGLVGLNEGYITESSASGTVSGFGSMAAGGLVGINSYGTLVNVKASGKVVDSSGANVGGLVGKSIRGAIQFAEATGAVVGGNSANIGGLIGHNIWGTTSEAAAWGKVDGGALSSVGGLVGYNEGDLLSVEAHGKVNAGNSSAVGGLAGTNSNKSSTIFSASAHGDVAGGNQSSVGGLVGQNNAWISNSLATGQVSGGSYARMGGLAGLNLGSVRESVAYGKINVVPRNYQAYGGLVGVNYGSLAHNTALGLAASVPPVGINQGDILE